MHKITFQDWHTSCGEPGCCDDYGTHLCINGKLITSQPCIDEDELRMILNALNVEYEIKILSYNGTEID